MVCCSYTRIFLSLQASATILTKQHLPANIPQFIKFSCLIQFTVSAQYFITAGTGAGCEYVSVSMLCVLKLVWSCPGCSTHDHHWSTHTRHWRAPAPRTPALHSSVVRCQWERLESVVTSASSVTRDEWPGPEQWDRSRVRSVRGGRCWWWGEWCWWWWWWWWWGCKVQGYMCGRDWCTRYSSGMHTHSNITRSITLLTTSVGWYSLSLHQQQETMLCRQQVHQLCFITVI